ncbi:MAG: hypothetical protein FWD18_02950 [Micrococcales bacterium]|nr:hypothetical protein [Micrococcales bacterium]
MVDRAVAAATAALVAVTALVTATATGCSTSVPASLPASPTLSPQPADLLTPADGASRVGELAPGFPSDLLPVPPGATVLVSVASQTSDDLWEVSLNVRTEQEAADLLDAVRAPLVAAGFVEQPADTPAVGLAVQTTFARAEGEVITVGIRDDGTVRTLTAGGTVVRQDAG